MNAGTPQPAAGPDDEAVLDDTIVDELSDFGPEFIAELVDAFDAQLVGMYAELETGLAAGDAEAVRRAAHLLKGSAGTIGLARAAAWASHLETLAKAGAVPAAAASVAQLRVAVEAGQAALRARMASDR